MTDVGKTLDFPARLDDPIKLVNGAQGEVLILKRYGDHSVMTVKYDGGVLEGRRPEETFGVVAEPVTLGGHAEHVLVELAIIVFVMERDDRICAPLKVGKDHVLRSGDGSHRDSHEPRAVVQ